MTSRIENKNLIISFDSRIDANNAANVEAEIKNLVAENPNLTLAFDAENLEYISSLGLRILLKFRKAAKKNLVIKNVSREVAEIFEISGFTNFFNLQKKLRQISIENLKEIGHGSTGSVYKLDDENILKVYYENWTLENVQNERANSQKALFSGLETAIAYDVVRVGKNFGIVYEMFKAETLDNVVLNNLEKVEFYAKKFAEFVKNQNAIEFEGVSGKQIRINLVKQMTNLDTEVQKLLLSALEKVPECKNFSHGDLNLSNIIVQDENFIMIDMGDISSGHPIFDVAWLYHMYETRQRNTKIVKGPKAMPEIFWKVFSQTYFNTTDEKILKHFEREMYVYGVAQVLISTLNRNLPEYIVRYYSEVLKKMSVAELPEIDF